MLFQEALDLLLKGKYVSRDVWDKTGEYCVLLPGMQYIWKIVTHPAPNAGNWLPLVSDFLGNDYKVIESLPVPAPEAPKAS